MSLGIKNEDLVFINVWMVLEATRVDRQWRKRVK
jgi:hypothetical protein